MNQKDKTAFVEMAKELHKGHGCAGSMSFETCTAEICVMARSIEADSDGENTYTQDYDEFSDADPGL